jgi:Histidine kinase-, DNA gyrase B-, and HSP90-like ATPase
MHTDHPQAGPRHLDWIDGDCQQAGIGGVTTSHMASSRVRQLSATAGSAEPTRRSHRNDIVPCQLRRVDMDWGVSMPPGRVPCTPDQDELLAATAHELSGLHRTHALLADRSVWLELPGWLPNLRVDVDASSACWPTRYTTRPGTHRDVGVWVSRPDWWTRGRWKSWSTTMDPGFRSMSASASSSASSAAAQRRQTRAGLGLAISRIVQAHGGDIGVGDAPGGGARFTVRLPLELAATEAGRARQSREN